MKTAVVAMGGNSITKASQAGTIPEQFENTRETVKHVVEMIKDGYAIVITHGNGPQVGNVLLRIELSQHEVYPLPLDVCDSDTQGGMGYMIQQVLGNKLRELGLKKCVATVVTQVIVAKDDPAFEKPAKPIGPFYTKEKAEQYQAEKGWTMVEDAGRGWRRVVPSPKPLEVVEGQMIKDLLSHGHIVIAVGGGGIPVVRSQDSSLSGIEAVIDKDLASSLLASKIGVDLLLISTDVEKVAINYGKESQKEIDRMTVEEAKQYTAQGHFPPGSMGPKIKAAIQFIENGGKEVIITNPENISRALKGETGTHISARPQVQAQPATPAPPVPPGQTTLPTQPDSPGGQNGSSPPPAKQNGAAQKASG